MDGITIIERMLQYYFKHYRNKHMPQGNMHLKKILTKQKLFKGILKLEP